MRGGKEMYCTYCGKQIEDNSKFCPYCGKGFSPTDADDFAEITVNPSNMGENKICDVENEQVQGHEEINGSSNKITKLVLSFIIGMVLSFITFLLIRYSSLTAIALIIISWIIFGFLAYTIILKLCNSKGLSGLSGVIIGAIAMWIFISIVGNWAEAIEMADTLFGIIIRLLPVGLIWTFIIYCIANRADTNNNSEK